MSVGSFSAGLSGLNANSQALSVVGNNLANLNTTGFKASAVSFQDLVYQNIGVSSENPGQVGLGVGVGQVSPVFAQGSIEATRTATNVAIQGAGFFMLSGPEGRSYTRAGDFSFDKDGRLVSPDGQSVLGFTTVDPLTKAIVTTGEPVSISVPPGALRAPVATTQFSAISNLNAGAANGSTFTTSIQIVDSVGATHLTTMTYTKTGTGAWSYSLTANGSEVAGGTPGAPSQLASGTIGFNGSGVLSTVNGAAPAAVAITTPAWSSGAAVSSLQWAVLDGNANPLLTGYAAPSATSSISQNGSEAGTVNSISINADGSMIATSGSGQATVIAQIALANFNNPQGLVKLGSNRYSEGSASGVRSVGVAGSGGRGKMIGSALEQSNVDMAQEFTHLIVAQRGYQASSKIITVSDQLLVDTLNIKQ
jgi:flagellar hook protein FlgE